MRERLGIQHPSALGCEGENLQFDSSMNIEAAPAMIDFTAHEHKHMLKEETFLQHKEVKWKQDSQADEEYNFWRYDW